MPDWNPAEIIGLKPSRLALSLYKELITDETWAFQRSNYGYRNLQYHPLLVSFIGVPFIDTRISFNSFIPKDLDENISNKLVNYYLKKLKENIKYHDKIEFEIIYSCYYFGIEKKLNQLKKHGFSDSELSQIKSSLLSLTNAVIDNKDGLYLKDLKNIEMLKTKYDDITKSKLSKVDKIYWLIQDAKQFGTLPFAGLARAGFIAVQWLTSFIDQGIFSKEDYDLFMTSLNTVSKNLTRDIRLLKKKEFLDIYGHLRPGTYDILSPRYDEDYHSYFNNLPNQVSDIDSIFLFSEKQKIKIKNLILKNGVNSTFEDLIIFIKKAIEGRELAKFLFTKHLSKALSYIGEYGARFHFTKEEISFLDVKTILDMYVTLDHRDVKDILSTDINKNKEYYNYTKAIKLPSVIVNPSDIYRFYKEKNDPNFVTLKQIQAPIVVEKDINNTNLCNHIICIKSADPGYDYLFSKNISGLITCYGGANSHMAIRCVELGIPAVIGCGEYDFERYSNAKVIKIDALNKNIKILS
tara:strand:+ start:9219 stop:10784 length:1566 start_codon:yes stop_codon:yes gene_type:complete